MSSNVKFSLGFDIAQHSFDEMNAAFEFYHAAFGAKKVTEFLPYESDRDNLHIIMEIYGITVLLHPGVDGEERVQDAGTWEFADEAALKKAIDVLSQGAKAVRMDSWPHWPIAAFITDRYGVAWTLHN